MQGHDNVVSRLESEGAPKWRGLDSTHVRVKRIDHRVADEEDPLVRYPGLAQILIGNIAGRKEEIRYRVGNHAIDLFWHCPIARPDPSLNMRDPDPELFCRDRAGHRRVDVTDNQAEISPLLH